MPYHASFIYHEGLLILKPDGHQVTLPVAHLTCHYAGDFQHFPGGLYMTDAGRISVVETISQAFIVHRFFLEVRFTES